MSKIRKGKRAAPKRRNIVHRHAKLRSGAGVHKDKRKLIVWREETEMELTLLEFREEHCIFNGTDMADAVKGWLEDTTAPAMCRNGCEVPHAGKCEHGCPSILVKLGKV